jgi:hypothetical protein
VPPGYCQASVMFGFAPCEQPLMARAPLRRSAASGKYLQPAAFLLSSETGTPGQHEGTDMPKTADHVDHRAGVYWRGPARQG